MTTPAQNVDEKESIFPKLPYVATRPGQQISGTISFQGAGRAKVQRRPASSSSPVRADGSRAPRAWEHMWGVFEPPVRGFSVTYTQAPWLYQVSGKIPVMGTDNSPSESYLTKMARAGGLAYASGFAAFPMNVRNAAITKLRLKIIDDKASWGVTLGEMRSTVKGVRSLCEQTLAFADSLAKRYRRTRREIWYFLLTNRWPPRRGGQWSRERRIRNEKEILSKHLEYQFSIRPLLADIEQSAEALSWLLFEDAMPMRFTVKAGASESWSSTWVTQWPRDYYSENWGTCHQPLVAQADIHFSLVYTIEPTTQTTYQQLGLTNVGAVAWELTTFSWMVDYILGVGDWLNSLVDLDGVKFVEGTESRKATVKSQPDAPVQLQPRAGATIRGGSGVIPRYEVGRFERLVLTSIPAPALLPAARNKLGLTQLANVLSVVAQLASR